jgi:hypothetical protein
MRIAMPKPWGFVAALTGMALFQCPLAHADTTMYTTSLQSGNMCTGCGPFGTISVSSVSGHSNELDVTLTLAPGEVFASTGAGSALLFDVAGNPTLTVMSLLPSGYSFHQTAAHADGSGNWNSFISCDICGSGTSPPQSSGPISFVLAVASGTLSPASFVTNGSFLFASDVGIPNGSGGYFTGDVVSSGPLTPVPLSGTAWLMLSGFGVLAVFLRHRQSFASSALAAA